MVAAICRHSGGARLGVVLELSSLTCLDEPTGGLDVSVQARLRIAVVLVTHDIAVARLLAGRMVVMQRGRVVETGLTDQVLEDPQHPYTQLLVSSVLQA